MKKISCSRVQLSEVNGRTEEAHQTTYKILLTEKSTHQNVFGRLFLQWFRNNVFDK